MLIFSFNLQLYIKQNNKVENPIKIFAREGKQTTEWQLKLTYTDVSAGDVVKFEGGIPPPHKLHDALTVLEKHHLQGTLAKFSFHLFTLKIFR